MTPPLVIRTAQADDLPYLVDASLRLERLEREGSATGLELSEEFPARLGEWYRTLLDQGNALFLVAADDEGPLGFCLAFVAPQPNEFTVFASHGLVQLLWTEPDRRGLGIGSQLLAAVESVFAEIGIAYADVSHAVANSDAGRYWAARGYQPDAIVSRKFFQRR